MDTRCVFCGKRPEEPDETKVMRLDKYYECYCVTLAKHRERSAIDPTESPSDSGSRVSELSAYGNDCPSGACEV